ncbi:TAXI family TRAP transporter solute-binding subunit [Amaricoccus macauensis]|uniref:TAXI family TRAP transporter solute-binding subunit n=1 Tax=Amaricoccus macauensis TaxID=57001 RepID=UPI003C7EAA6E
MIRLNVPCAVATLLAVVPCVTVAQEARLVRMATGSPAGVYFPVGLSLCRLVNENRSEHKIRCAAETSEGSLDNLEKLRAKDVDLAIVQSDVQAAASTGDNAFDTMRAVMSLYPETVTIVAGSDTDIDSLAALEGKRISAGPMGSAQRAMWNTLMAAEGWTEESFADLLDLSPADQASSLCEGQIDAFVTTIGHPALTVQEATLGCDAEIVPVESPEIEQFVSESSALVQAEIPGGLYAGHAEPIPSFGVTATVITRTNVSEEIVYTFVSAALINLDRLRLFDPALADLEIETMASAGLSVPLHDGAAQAFDAAANPVPAN